MTTEDKTITLVQFSDRTEEIGRELRIFGWLLSERRTQGYCFREGEDPIIDLGYIIEKLGQELIDFQKVKLVDHEGNVL